MIRSGNITIRNYVKPSSILIAILIYAVAGIYSVGIFLIPAVIIWIITSSIIKAEISSISKRSTEFRRTYPFKYYGSSHGTFLHVFHHSKDITSSLIHAIGSTVCTQTPVSGLQSLTITDIDPCLTQPEERVFLATDSLATQRGTTVTLLIKFQSYGQMQSIQWWVLAGGYIDSNMKFNFIAYSPFTIWFWGMSYLKKEYDLLKHVRNVHSSTYNSFDVDGRVRCLHEAVFQSLITELDGHGIDTSSLKQQRLQAINISVSGGSFSAGNIMQGLANRATNVNNGAQA